MKIRHVRAIAVFGIALVALTGARGSHGGSCGGSSSSSSSSGGSSTGGSHNDNDSTTGGGSVSGGGSSANQAMRDISIAKCGLDAAGKNLTARLTIRNSDSLDYKYNASVQFKGEIGGPSADLAVARLDAAAVPAGESVTKEISTPYTGSGDGSEYKKCEVVLASRTAG
ncbi:hypothetical protein ABZ208_04480 [Streptomyces sp. NPDC006208]|uniref:hypothetical protein n=1 Tax=Streptomyces sp. NPDC006208 TaxID=3156734 RepID=UPI0033A17D48